MTCITMISFILSVSIVYSAEPQKPIKPQQGVVPSQQQPPQVSPVLKTGDVKIIITSPSAGEPIEIGAIYNIQWTKIGQMSPFVDIELFQGNLIFGIAATTPNDVVYEWLVPNQLQSGQYQIRIKGSDDKKILSESAIFKLYRPGIKITSPKIADILYFNKTYSVTWDKFGDTGSYIISSYRMASDPAKKQDTVGCNSNPNNGNCIWNIRDFGYKYCHKECEGSLTYNFCKNQCEIAGKDHWVAEYNSNNEYILTIETGGGPKKYKDEIKIRILH